VSEEWVDMKRLKPEPRNRRLPGTSLVVRVLNTEEVNRIIRELKKAKKLTLHRGGNSHVTIHDAKDPEVKCIIMVDLTQEALGRHVKD